MFLPEQLAIDFGKSLQFQKGFSVSSSCHWLIVNFLPYRHLSFQATPP